MLPWRAPALGAHIDSIDMSYVVGAVTQHQQRSICIDSNRPSWVLAQLGAGPTPR